MKKKKKYLELYEKLMADKKLPSENGLCNEGLRYDPLFELMTPTEELKFGYWGYGRSMTEEKYRRSSPKIKEAIFSEFTPLRQTIVLFMAAMNDEL